MKYTLTLYISNFNFLLGYYSSVVRSPKDPPTTTPAISAGFWSVFNMSTRSRISRFICFSCMFLCYTCIYLIWCIGIRFELIYYFVIFSEQMLYSKFGAFSFLLKLQYFKLGNLLDYGVCHIFPQFVKFQFYMFIYLFRVPDSCTLSICNF